ncbi:hypothetical protein LTR94_038164, partial [Friedmanniomyces endolithicus]
MATRTHRPNEEPYRDFLAADPDAEGLSKAELEFQLSFKMKMAETLFELTYSDELLDGLSIQPD